MLCTRNLKVRLEGTLTSLENDLQHVNNEIHALNKKIDAVQQVMSREWVVGCSFVVGMWLGGYSQVEK